MKTQSFTFNQGLNLDKFNDDLIAANIPGLAPVNGVASYTLLRTGTNTVVLTVADSVDWSLVQAVVNAHTATAPTRPADTTRPDGLPQALRDKLQPGGGAFTAAEQMAYNRINEQRWRYMLRVLTGSAE